jgi:hypothetical protein
MKNIRLLLTTITCWVALAAAMAQADLFGGGNKDSNAEELMSLFGKTASFTATAHMQLAKKDGKVAQTAEMDYAVRDGMVRTLVDMTKTSAAKGKEEQMGEMAAMGMNVMIMIMRRDENVSYLVYPGMKSYCVMPITKGADGKAKAEPTITRKELGTEEVEGHDCRKELVTIETANGKKTEMTVWSARDLDNFPIKTQVMGRNGLVTTVFKNLKRETPDASLFVPPQDYTKYDSVQEMMMGGMRQMMKMGGGME